MVLTPEKRYVNIRSKLSVGFIVCAFALAACSGSASIGITPTDVPVSAEAPAEEAAAEEVPAEEAPAEEAPAEEAPADSAAVSTFPVGELGKSRSNPVGWDVSKKGEYFIYTITEIVTDATAAAKIVEDGHPSNIKAPEGYQYYVIRYTAENIAADAKPQSPWMKTNFWMTGSSLATYTKPEGAWLPSTECTADVEPTKTASCEVVFLLPVDETNKILVLREADTTYFMVDDAAMISPLPSTSQNSTNGSTSASPAVVGEIVDSSSGDVSASFSITEVIRGEEAAARIAAECSSCEKAPAGQEYILANVVMTFHGDSKLPDDTFTPGSVTLKIVGGMQVEYESPYGYAPKPVFSAQNAIYAGGTAAGWVVLSAPIAETGRQIVISPYYSAENKRFVTIE
jgi:hypothetical protein